MPTEPRLKRIAGVLGDLTGLNEIGYRAQRRSAEPLIRGVNYHSVGDDGLAAFERQLEYFADKYENVTPERLTAFFEGTWRPKLPGLLVSSDDGLRTDFDVMAPALERYGFTGWFFVPADLTELPVSEQLAVARAARITPLADRSDGRIFLTPAEVRSLAERHVVGCHTATHVRLSSELDANRLRTEIVDSRSRLGAHAGRPIDTFCWVGGEPWAYSRTAATVIRAAGYSFAFMTNSSPIRPTTNPLQLDRTNIEGHFSLPLVRLRLSGAIDARLALQRRRAKAVTDVGLPLCAAPPAQP